MIDFSAFRSSIETFISQNFDTVPVVFENTAVEPVNTEHIEVYDQQTESSLVEMGVTDTFIEGVLTIRIFTAIGEGTDKAGTIASELVALFSVTTITGVDFSEPIFKAIGEEKKRPLYQHALLFPYSYVYGQNNINDC